MMLKKLNSNFLDLEDTLSEKWPYQWGIPQAYPNNIGRLVAIQERNMKQPH